MPIVGTVRSAKATGIPMNARRTSGSDPASVFAPPLEISPMEAKSAEALPDEPGRWQFEPKWDGFRCLASKRGESVRLMGKSGKPLDHYFPEVVETLLQIRSSDLSLTANW